MGADEAQIEGLSGQKKPPARFPRPAAFTLRASPFLHVVVRRSEAGAPFFSSGFSATIASVVSSRPATDAAFCSAVRTTLVGSTMPAFIRSSNSSVAALKPKAPLPFVHLVEDDRAFPAGVVGDPAAGILEGAADDVARRPAPRRGTLRSSSAAAARTSATPPPGHDAFLDRGAGRVQRVLDARLLLLHLDLGGGADADHGHAADQLRQPLLQLLAVVVGGGLLDLGADLLDAALDVGLLAGAVDDGGVVLVDRRCAWRGRGR